MQWQEYTKESMRLAWRVEKRWKREKKTHENCKRNKQKQKQKWNQFIYFTFNIDF